MYKQYIFALLTIICDFCQVIAIMSAMILMIIVYD